MSSGLKKKRLSVRDSIHSSSLFFPPHSSLLSSSTPISHSSLCFYDLNNGNSVKITLFSSSSSSMAAALLESIPAPPSRLKAFLSSTTGTLSTRLTLAASSSSSSNRFCTIQCQALDTTSKVPRRSAMALISSSILFSQVGSSNIAMAQPSTGFREYLDTFDGYTFLYPKNWIQVKGAGADIFFRDPYILDENISVEISSPSSSNYKSVEDLGPPQAAAKKVLQQYLTEFMSTRLGVRRQSKIVATSSRTADDGRVYYQVEVNIKSYANNNELAVMPEERVTRLEWDRRYLSVLGVENNQLYELRLQTPENVFLEEESDLRQIMDSFRVMKSNV